MSRFPKGNSVTIDFEATVVARLSPGNNNFVSFEGGSGSDILRSLRNSTDAEIYVASFFAFTGIVDGVHTDLVNFAVLKIFKSDSSIFTIILRNISILPFFVIFGLEVDYVPLNIGTTVVCRCSPFDGH